MERNEQYYILDNNCKVKFICSMKANATDYMTKHPDMTMVIATSEREAILLAREMQKYGDES